MAGSSTLFANGIDDSPVLAQPEEAKGYSISTTLEEDVTTAARANQILLALSDSVAARMRGDGAKASCVAVTIRTNTFQTRSHQQKLYEPTDITSEIYALSRRLFAELWEAPTPLRLLGISLTEISHGEAAQISLFTDEKREKFRRLDQTLDALRSRYGMDTIRRGSAMQSDIEVGGKIPGKAGRAGRAAIDGLFAAPFPKVPLPVWAETGKSNPFLMETGLQDAKAQNLIISQ